MIVAASFALAAIDAPASSAEVRLHAAEESFEFDIPAGPLVEALRRYASVTRQPTLFRSDLVNGRRSTAVRGLYSSEAALYQLLEGSGLTVEKSDAGAGGGFLLKEIEPSNAAPRASLGSLAGYPSLIQARVWEALCADVRTAPGAYRTLLRFQVDASGQIERPRMLSSTGDVRRDGAVLAALHRVRMDAPPPRDLQQPVTMLIVPRDHESADEPYCRSGAF